MLTAICVVMMVHSGIDGNEADSRLAIAAPAKHIEHPDGLLRVLSGPARSVAAIMVGE